VYKIASGWYVWYDVVDCRRIYWSGALLDVHKAGNVVLDKVDVTSCLEAAGKFGGFNFRV
jgi:hypothetical protein